MDGKKKFANNIEKEKQERKCVAMSAELPLSPEKVDQGLPQDPTRLNYPLAPCLILTWLFFFDILFR